MKNREDYKPSLPSDTDYIKKVADSITRKAPLEEITFSLLSDVLEDIGISEDPYALIHPDRFDVEAVTAISTTAFQDINNHPLSPEHREKLYALWDYLAASDEPEKSDLIFVFGGGEKSRAELAVELYQAGLAPRILFTGRNASYMKDDLRSEAELFAEIAVQQGVPTEDIILEKEAKNTPENAVNSVRLLKERGELPKKIILVAVEFQMRRAYLTFKGAVDWNPKLIRQPARSAKYQRLEYWADTKAWSYVFLEFIKLYAARQMGHF